jgi:hypothetical protein
MLKEGRFEIALFKKTAVSNRRSLVEPLTRGVSVAR